MAEDGSVLPETLLGYTGRRAVSTGNSTKDFSGNFEIKPGYQTQVVQLNNAAELTTEHFYVQVIGENFDGNPSFESPGAGSGKLQTRPAKYVPIKVPIFNELDTLDAQNALRDAKQEGIKDLPDEVAPVYHWVYRPEMQFSVFDLTNQELQIQDSNDDVQIIDLTLDNSAELVGSLLSGDLNYVGLLYDLIGSDFEPLQPFGSERELIFSLGGEEVKATVSPDEVIRFENSQHLDLLDAGDYLFISLYQNSDSANVLWEFAFEKIHLIADMNNDGQIIKQSTAKNDTDFIDTVNSEETPFLFWVNNDDDEGKINEGKGAEGDVPDAGVADYEDDKIDGMRDLVDFFPVYVDIKSALDSFPSSEYTYRLMHLDSGLKFVETDFLSMSDNDLERVDAPLKESDIAFGLSNKTVTEITNTGAILSNEFLNKIQNERGGIILVEASKVTEEPLRLEVINNSNQRLAAHAELSLKVSPIEDMYRNIDLKPFATQRGAATEQGLAENISEPKGNPDDRTQANYLVFIHGYNVSPEAARGWNAEMFKRFHRLGFNGRFIATNWHGKTGLDYHHAVYNAFQTSMNLNSSIQSAMPESGPLTVAGHSLGNVVASNAIAHGGLTPTRYFMINAATPIEAYDSAQTIGSGITMKDNMTEIEWQDYPEEMYAANWYNLFDAGDDRRQLTWKEYFSEAVPYAYNFYSPGEDVVENANAGESFSGDLWNNILDFEFSQHAWVMQEMGKGCQSLIAWGVFECSGGWEFNNKQNDLEFIGKPNPDYDFIDNPVEFIPYENGLEATTARDSKVLLDENLAQYGFFYKFNHFENNESEYSYLYQSTTETVTLQSEQHQQHQWDILASGVPAISFAAAANPMNKLNPPVGENRNFNMEALRGDDQTWPIERFGDWQKRWLHSDIRNVALPYVHDTFDIMLEIGEFKE